MLIESVLMLILRQPCMFADMSSLVRDAVVPVPALPTRASFVNLSLMLFNCANGGNMMCTSGSRHWGSCNPAMVSGPKTLTGTSCVMIVSRLPPPNVASNAGSRPSSLMLPAVGNAAYEFEDDVVTMVRASNGMLSFLVRRIWADEAFKADLRARLRDVSGTSRLMTLFAADWTVYVSKMASCGKRY